MTRDTQERLQKLERQSRQFKCGGALVFLALSAFVLMGHTASKRRTVRAEEFQLVDSHDKLMGRMRVDGKNPEIELFNQSGVPTVELYAYDSGNTGGLLLSDVHSGATMRSSPASLVLIGKDGKVLWRVPMGNTLSSILSK